MKTANAMMAGAFALLMLVAVPSWRAPAQARQDLSGRWMMAQLSTTVASVPVVGDVYATSRLVALHNLKHEGERLHGKGMLCQLDIDTGSRWVSTMLPSAFMRALPRPFIDGIVHRDAGGGLRFDQPKQTLVVGARLREPEHDPLPSAPNDPHVFDQDGDGRPGVTIEIDGIVSGQIHVAQRSWTRLSGTSFGPEGFAGRLLFGNEQIVLGATSHMLEDPPVSRPVPSRSWFRMVRLPKSTRCRGAMEMAAGWFK